MAASASKKASKNAYRRAKKKAQRSENPSHAADSERDAEAPPPEDSKGVEDPSADTSEPIVVDDITNHYDLDDPELEAFKKVFEKFREPTVEEAAKAQEKPEVYYDDDDIPNESDEERKKKSKRKRKMESRYTVAELKALVKKPELVEWTDISSPDPLLLLAIKSFKNVVPVPNHWSLKREYLSSKRGIEKPPFVLPKFIQETGISEMRDAVLERQAEMTLKQRQRERVQGKLGKIDMDYGKLYDAFFRRQTKPEMTRYGEVYYEGKEMETNLVHLKPGVISEELKEALGMAPGHPPPWLINQQRSGPPPSYPHLKIPGVNAPIPPGANWGFTPGQWGRPPVDEATHRPTWGGDPLGSGILYEQPHLQVYEDVNRKPWGVLRAEGESEDEDEEDDEDEEEDEEEEEPAAAIEDAAGYTTSMGTASAMPMEIGGTESISGEFTLRKQRKGYETEEPSAPRSAYQVIPQKDIKATGFFGGEHAYDLDAARKDRIGDNSQRKRKAGDVDVSVDVDMLAENGKVDKETLKSQYDEKRRQEMAGQWSAINQDELSDMIAAESRKRQKREEKKGGRK